MNVSRSAMIQSHGRANFADVCAARLWSGLRPSRGRLNVRRLESASRRTFGEFGHSLCQHEQPKRRLAPVRWLQGSGWGHVFVQRFGWQISHSEEVAVVDQARTVTEQRSKT